jgi:hypothetical protein
LGERGGQKLLQVTVRTSLRAVGGPFLSLMVTAPEAPDQVRTKGWPATTLKLLLVNWTAWATAANSATARTEKDFMVGELGGLKKWDDSAKGWGKMSVFTLVQKNRNAKPRFRASEMPLTWISSVEDWGQWARTYKWSSWYVACARTTDDQL